MLEKLKDWMQKWLGLKAESDGDDRRDKYVSDYENLNTEDVTATIANKLAMLVFADSTMRVKEKGAKTPGKRVELIDGVLKQMWENGGRIVAQAFGKGGKLLVPVCANGKIRLHVMDHDRIWINATDGARITQATLIVDAQRIDDKKYYLLADYTLAENAQIIRYRAATQSDALVDLSVVPAWAQITPEITIADTDKLLLAYLKCPRDNRTDHSEYGVPITYGAEKWIAQLEEHGGIYRREYRMTRPMLGLDASLWKNPNERIDKVKKPRIEDVKATVQDDEFPFIPCSTSAMDGKSMWQYYAPAIRDAAMDRRDKSLERKIEKACGLSQGILTERQDLNYANRDEVRAAQYDTFSVVRAMRDNWEKAADDVAYAVDVLAERFGVTPYGNRDRYEITFDWDTSLIESTTEAFEQLQALKTMNLISGPYLRSWTTGESLEEAEEAVKKLRESGEGESEIDRALRLVENRVDNSRAMEE